MDTSGWNAGNACEKKHKPNPPVKNHSNQPKLPRTQTRGPSITQNLCVKFAERWDTLLGIVITGTRPPQHTEVFRIPNSQRKKIDNSERTLDKTTMGHTTPMSCLTLPRTWPTTTTKWNDMMTWRTQKAYKATSSKFTTRKCAPRSTTTDYYTKTTNN